MNFDEKLADGLVKAIKQFVAHELAKQNAAQRTEIESVRTLCVALEAHIGGFNERMNGHEKVHARHKDDIFEQRKSIDRIKTRVDQLERK